MQDKIIILMATYNGEKYISTQIDSVIEQTYKNWELWIRDDCSNDKTIAIIKRYSAKDYRINLYIDNLGNLGALGNFSTLLENIKYENYVMFCDQDDFWLPFKIEITLAKMKDQECITDKPILIYSPLQKVDNDLKTIKTKTYNLPTDITINKIISQNFIYGCTMMLNNELIKLSNPMSKKAENHDYWIAMIAAQYGIIKVVDKVTILYRQHDNNVSGSYKDSFFVARLKRLFTDKYNEYQKQKNIMIKALIIHLKNKNKDTLFLEKYIDAVNHAGINAIIFVIKNKVYKYGTGLSSNIVNLISLYKYKEVKDDY
jgi:rhamnosyltransferase